MNNNEEIKKQVLHVLGNLKGNVINAENAFLLINQIYTHDITNG